MELIALNQSYSPLGIEWIVHVKQGLQFIHYLTIIYITISILKWNNCCFIIYSLLLN